MKLSVEVSCLALTKKRVRYVFHSCDFINILTWVFVLRDLIDAVVRDCMGPEQRLNDCVKAKENLRAKRRGVNSVFLVQLRKKLCGKQYESSRVKKFFLCTPTGVS